ncbi:ribosome biogenesis GTPase Der [Thiotrichales bacterium 19S9-12]|nr:ribosome biogenesis GTPase Der [Thiotrichales bacterium 19S9-11]MCF6811025.1 ribosome biogenesis GTPase Der [Thiotrichales bacterium 19S9-12]
MSKVIALVGRPNVGKSTLFNALTKSRDALVYDMPGVTRDRQYGQVTFQEQTFIVIDTGGLFYGDEGIDEPMAEQALLAVEEADIVYFLVDGRSGLNASDQAIADLLRAKNKSIYLVVNKIDGLEETSAIADFYTLGFPEIKAIAASHRRGVTQLLEDTLSPYIEPQALHDENWLSEKTKGIRFALIGRPNVGKSTLTNRMLGEDRVVVYDMPGTTRDSIYIPFSRYDQDYTVIDTAGLRRKGRVKQTLEKFSVVKTLQAIKDAHVAVIVVDAKEGLTDQDLHMVGFAVYSGRAIVIAVNKWDGLTDKKRLDVREAIKRKLDFVSEYADIHFISALHGTNVGHLFESIYSAYESAFKEIPTTQLTEVLKLAVTEHQPPLVGRYRIKPKYAHMGGHNPPRIIIHGNLVDKLSKSYQRYLMSYFREAFSLSGTPINLELKPAENPFKDKPNKHVIKRLEKHGRKVKTKRKSR